MAEGTGASPAGLTWLELHAKRAHASPRPMGQQQVSAAVTAAPGGSRHHGMGRNPTRIGGCLQGCKLSTEQLVGKHVEVKPAE